MAQMDSAALVPEIEREVKEAVKALRKLKQAKEVTPLDLMLDSKEIEARIMSTNLSNRERNRVSAHLDLELLDARSSLLILTMMLLPLFLGMLIPDFRYGLLVTFTGPFIAIGAGLLLTPHRAAKLFKRKILRENVAQILKENQVNSERNRKLVDNTEANLAKVKKRLEGLALTYSQVYPGRKLVLTSGDNPVIIETNESTTLQKMLSLSTTQPA